MKRSDFGTEFRTFFVTVFFWFTALLIMVFVQGLTLSMLWRWFVVPLFHAPRIGLIAGAGLMLTTHLVTLRVGKDDRRNSNTDTENIKDQLYIMFMGSVFALLVLAAGWIFHLFM